MPTEHDQAGFWTITGRKKSMESGDFLVCEKIRVGPLKHFRARTVPEVRQLSWQSPPKNKLAEKTAV